jgi:hypothetical protein
VKSLKAVKAELLANPAVRQAYDAQAPEFELARELIAARTQAKAWWHVSKVAGARHPCEQSSVLPVPWECVLWCGWSLWRWHDPRTAHEVANQN